MPVRRSAPARNALVANRERKIVGPRALYSQGSTIEAQVNRVQHVYAIPGRASLVPRGRSRHPAHWRVQAPSGTTGGCPRTTSDSTPSFSERLDYPPSRPNFDNPTRAGHAASLTKQQRRSGDSNPRQAFDLRPLSKRVPSATRSPLPKARPPHGTRNRLVDKEPAHRRPLLRVAFRAAVPSHLEAPGSHHVAIARSPSVKEDMGNGDSTAPGNACPHRWIDCLAAVRNRFVPKNRWTRGFAIVHSRLFY